MPESTDSSSLAEARDKLQRKLQAAKERKTFRALAKKDPYFKTYVGLVEKFLTSYMKLNTGAVLEEGAVLKDGKVSVDELRHRLWRQYIDEIHSGVGFLFDTSLVKNWIPKHQSLQVSEIDQIDYGQSALFSIINLLNDDYIAEQAGDVGEDFSINRRNSTFFGAQGKCPFLHSGWRDAFTP